MKPVGMNLHYVRYPLVRFLNDMTDLGFKYVELWLGAPHFSLDEITRDDMFRLRHELDIRGLICTCVTPEQCTYPVNYGISDDRLRRRSIEYFKKAIDTAEVVGAPRVLVTPGYDYFDNDPSIGWMQTRGALQELAHYAAPKGITLLLEALLHTTTRTINTSAQIADMIREVDAPNLMGMLDLSQMVGNGEDIETFTATLGDKLQYLHLVDGTPVGHLPLGDGTNDLCHCLDVLSASGYNGFASFEITSSDYFEDPTAACRKSLDWFVSHGYND